MLVENVSKRDKIYHKVKEGYLLFYIPIKTFTGEDVSVNKTTTYKHVSKTSETNCIYGKTFFYENKCDIKLSVK